MAILLKVGRGDLINVKPKAGRKKFTLEELQRYVDGYIEHIVVNYAGSGRDMLVNEDGIRLGLALNMAASQLAGQPIRGDALLLERAEWE